MKAAVCERYGPPEVVQIVDVPAPDLADDQVLIRTRAVTVNSGDARLRAMRVPRGLGWLVRLRSGITKPRQPICGFDTAGEVEAVGSAVSRFQPGDRVVGSRGFKFGCHAELVAVPEDGAIAAIPDGVSYEDAVSVLFGGSTAVNFFQLAKLEAGETILINGASGAVGTMSVQLAKHMGAEVTGVCSGAHVDLVKSLGADHVVDYTTDDFASNGQRYDVIMDNHGNAPYGRIKGSLADGGRFVMIIGGLGPMLAATWQKPTISPSRNQNMLTTETYQTLMSLMAEGALRPVIDSTFPFDQVAEAHRRVDTDHKAGSVVLTLD